MGIWLAIGYMLAGAVIALLCFMLTHRRLTPYLHLQLDELPSLHDGMQALAGLTGGAVYEGNRCSVLQNGALFPAMIADIEAARHTVHLETFVWTAGEVERQFVEVLCSKARQGVKVRLLIDALGGSGATRERLQKLRDAGVELAEYCRPGWWNLRRFNHRTHRKLLIVDGASRLHVRSRHRRSMARRRRRRGSLARYGRAPGRSGGQARCSRYSWRTGSKRRTACPRATAAIHRSSRKGDVAAHVVSSASEEVGSKVALLYTVAIASARKEVIVQNPYFAPDDGVCELFAKMVKRGVAVHLMVPGRKTDSPFVRIAGSHLYLSLLEAGVHVYEFEPTLPHQKVVIVDRIWSHVGSTNFDARSLALNEEVGVGVLDERTAEELRAAFEADLRRSKELQLERWRQRPLLERGYSWLAYQLHSQL